MFVSIKKYSRKCSSFYFLIMSQDNTYKICLLMKPEVRDKGQKNNSVTVSVKVTCCRNPFKDDRAFSLLHQELPQILVLRFP